MRALVIGATALLASSASLAQTVDQKAIDFIYEKLLESAEYLQAGEPLSLIHI